MQPMPINRDREKLADAIVFFQKNTKSLGLTKLFKLLFLLDFTTFARTGRSATGLKYETWEFGPAPRSLWTEIRNGLGADLAGAVEFKDLDLADDLKRTNIAVRREFDGKHFTKGELRSLHELADVFRDATAKQMVDVTHVRNSPWAKTKAAKGMNAEIDYDLALDSAVKDGLTREALAALLDDLRTSEPAA